MCPALIDLQQTLHRGLGHVAVYLCLFIRGRFDPAHGMFRGSFYSRIGSSMGAVFRCALRDLGHFWVQLGPDPDRDRVHLLDGE
jgi:hypothetical protein